MKIENGYRKWIEILAVNLIMILNGGWLLLSMTHDTQMERGLLNLDDFCEYLGIKKTKARELLHNPSNGFTVRIGNRLYAHKKKLDEWLLNQIIQ